MNYDFNFNFTSPGQQHVLQELQQGNCTLAIFFASGSGLGGGAGLPATVATPFQQVFGQVNIQVSTDLFQVYVCNQSQLAPGEVVTMDAVSQPVPLGTALVFNQNGTFSPGGQAQPGTIQLSNNTSNAVTVGLALHVNGQWQPFSASISIPQTVTLMQGPQQSLLFATPMHVVPGQLVPNAPSEGGSLELTQQSLANFEVVDGTFAVQGINQTVTNPVAPGSPL